MLDADVAANGAAIASALVVQQAHAQHSVPHFWTTIDALKGVAIAPQDRWLLVHRLGAAAWSAVPAPKSNALWARQCSVVVDAGTMYCNKHSK
jgi:hypothetical protein